MVEKYSVYRYLSKQAFMVEKYSKLLVKNAQIAYINPCDLVQMTEQRMLGLEGSSYGTVDYEEEQAARMPDT